MASPARRDGLKRREELLDAALRCFGERGLLGTGIEEIRREAGASPSSVYHLFDGLPGLTLALLIRTFERLSEHLAERVAPTIDAADAVVSLVDGHLEWVLGHPDEARFLYQATALDFGVDANEALRIRKSDLFAPLVARLNRFIAEGALPPWPPSTLDVVLLGPSHEACRRFLAGAPLDPEWMRSTLPRLAWQSLVRGCEDALFEG
ncbi:MAG: TetR/AcrR family transcriptional regulator [Polyangiaceae bacterium]|jgi:AcrR family transcriptional regulator|nr:TetR/AcrR family transcriptional regulator [Polyangiaceae bacterium]